ncbi:unnamed protein product [Brugia timori]|uniref:Uncharacterized protein n=1 Tax=Brugia timori TaxID=42155 RepID=A0A0R3QZV1_9BILA|nr:unnamed protein product [Brugia timori]
MLAFLFKKYLISVIFVYHKWKYRQIFISENLYLFRNWKITLLFYYCHI